MQKRCFKCLCVKPIDDFYKHVAMKDGHLNKCKDCTKRDERARRLADIDRIRAYDRARASMPHRVASRSAIIKKWKAEHPNRRRAQNAVANAIRDGKLEKWPVCAMPECDRKPEAHHPDYDSPLEVVWLCRPHHMQAHAIEAEAV